MTRSRLAALLLAGLFLAGAAWALLLAVDARRWSGTLRNGDMEFRIAPANGDLWRQKDITPGGMSGRMLQIGDDVAYRRAVRAFVRADPRQLEFSDARVLALRGEAEEKLVDVAEKERDQHRRSLVENFLGALDLVAAAQDDTLRPSLLQHSVQRFRRAITLDPSNEDAKHNLELALSRQESASPSSSPDNAQGRRRRGAAGAAAGPRQGSGY